MRFSTSEVLVKTSDGHNMTLMEPFTYTSRNGEVICVTAGTKTDGASTPRALWPTVPPFGLYWLAAFLHDYLYSHTQKSKEECDGLFLEAMEDLGVPEYEAKIIYDGVYFFGWKAFREDRVAPS